MTIIYFFFLEYLQFYFLHSYKKLTIFVDNLSPKRVWKRKL